MTNVDRQQQNFDGNERVDLPDFLNILTQVLADHRFFIKNYIDDSAARIVKAYQIASTSGLTLNIRADLDRGFHDVTSEWAYKSATPSGSLISITLADNSTNYVQVAINDFTDNLATRVFWDVDIGVAGSSVLDEINIRSRIDELVYANQSQFLPGSVKLWEVVTSGGAVTSIQSFQDVLWHPRTFTLPANNDRTSVYEPDVTDLRSYIDLTGALWSEVKGTGELMENAPWSSLKLLREYQNLFFVPGTQITWDAETGVLSWNANITIALAGRSSLYTIATGSVTLTDGECMYVDITEGTPSGSLTPVVAALSAVPINPQTSGQSPRTMVLFYRNGTFIASAPHLPDLEDGESATIGQDLAEAIAARLGITSDTTYVPYTSDVVIGANDNYAVALSKLDQTIGAINENIPLEMYWTGTQGTGSGNTIFTNSTALAPGGDFTWNSSNTFFDIEVFVDGRKQYLDSSGATGFRKLNTTQIQLAATPDSASVITIAKKGTAYGVVPSSGGNLWSDPVDSNITPNNDLVYALGSSSKRFESGYIDTLYCREIVYADQVGNIETVKQKKNGTASLIAQGTIVSLYGDGQIYPGVANTAQGAVFIGIAVENIASGAFGRVLLFGPNVPGVLTSLGFTPGQKVMIDNTGAYVPDGGGTFTDGSALQHVGWADCPDGNASGTVTDLILAHQDLLQVVNPVEDVIYTVEGQTAYTLPGMTLNPSNDVLDVQLWYDGIYQVLDGTGAQGFMKTGTNTILLSEAPSLSGKEIVFRSAGIQISAGGGGGGGVDLTNITVSPQPTSLDAGLLDIGSATKPWSGILMKDDVTNQVWRLSISNGMIQAVQVGTL